jgi:3-hydroxyacyl-CoA dehydrogenase
VPDVIIEATSESQEHKRKTLTYIGDILEKKTSLLLSNSSSILPADIHPDAVGCHFFYPVELTGVVEVVFNDRDPKIHTKEILSWLRDGNLIPVIQNSSNAFAVNRLLLPVQAETFRVLMQGHSPALVNKATQSELLPFGQLSFMDSVGIDVVYNSVLQYISRMSPSLCTHYAPLKEGLAILVSAGKTGNKNKNGLLTGSALPWQASAEITADFSLLQKRFFYLFINTCFSFLHSHQITPSDLDLVLQSIFQAETTFDALIQRQSLSDIRKMLESLYRETGLSYFVVP